MDGTKVEVVGVRLLCAGERIIYFEFDSFSCDQIYVMT